MKLSHNSAQSAGRPPLVNREFLQEAAFELFQLQGYSATSVSQIARTAGVSRATFFNHFSAKADLFWVEADRLIADFAEFLDQAKQTNSASTIETLMTEFASSLDQGDVPWALKHSAQIASAEDLAAASASRVLHLADLIERFLEAGEPRLSALQRRGRATALTSLMVTAVLAWAEAGVSRENLAHYLDQLLP